MDYIIVFSNDWIEHLTHLRSAFACLQQPGVTLQLPKCQFGLDRVYYLGHIIGGGELQLDPKKLEAVALFKRPETNKEVNTFVGLASYYWKFIPDFVSIATPLTDLLKMKQPE